MTRILFDATSLALTSYHKAGAYRYGIEVARRMPGLMPSGWRFDLYFNFFRSRHLPGMRDALQELGDPAHELVRWHPRLLDRFRIPIEWTGCKTDLFHGPFDLVPISRRAKLITTIHDLAFLRAPKGLPEKWIRMSRRRVPDSARRATIVITVSEFSKRDIIERLGIPEERVEVIYHGVSSGYTPPADPEADAAHLQQQFGIEPGYLLYLGTLQPNKNLERLCEAYALMRARGCERPLVLAGGEGWLFDEMWGRIVGRGHDAGVVRTGYVDKADIPRLYGAAAAFCLPSVLEGFGIPVIEAMSCGAPVVAANACSLPEVAGDAGILVDANDPEALADALLLASEEGAPRRAMVQAGLDRAKLFTWKRSARRHIEVYRRAMEIDS